MPVAAIADQTVRYRFDGTRPDRQRPQGPGGPVRGGDPAGRPEVTTSVGIGGALTSAQRTEFTKASVRLCRMAAVKVADRLGR